MPKAKGEPLWDYTSLNDKNYLLTNIDKHYKASPDKFIKFAQDYNDILEENLEIDPYPNNFLFDENDGTAFVDIRCLENKPKPARIVYGLCAPCLRIIDEKTRETMHDSEYKTIIDKNAAIFDKCVTAMGEIGINKAFIDERLNTKNSTLPEPKLYIAGINEK
jgi:hypothetical protein